jgi:hypothetical protein
LSHSASPQITRVYEKKKPYLFICLGKEITYSRRVKRLPSYNLALFLLLKTIALR